MSNCMIKLTIFTVLALLFLHSKAECQMGQSPIAFDHLTVEDGLSHNTVYTIIQDKNGLIWMGTRYGLNRYDGYDCKVILPIEGDSFSLNSPTVLTLTEDRFGKIWAGHREGGISVWNPSLGKFESFPKGKASEDINWNETTIRQIYEDSRGWIWVATTGYGAFIFDEKREKIGHLCTACMPKTKALSSDFVFDFQEDKNGKIWIATDGQGLNGYDPATESTFFVNSTDSLHLRSFEKSLCLDSEGNLWVGTAGSGLYKYDLLRKQFTHFFSLKNKPNGLSHNIIMDLATDSLGNLWIGTDGGGLNILDPKTGNFSQISSTASFPQALNSNAIYHLMFDRIGNLWVGTFNGGVNIHKAFSPPFFIHENQNEYHRLGLQSVLALVEDTNGIIWLGTDGGGLFFTNSKSKSIDLQSVKSISKKVVTCLQAAPNNGLWVGSFADGLSFLDTRSGQTRHFRHIPGDGSSLSHNNVWALALDNAGGLWIGTLGGGLNYLPSGATSFKRFQPVPGDPTSLSSVQVVDVLLDRNGKYLWVATEDQGLNRVTIANGEIKRYSSNGADPSKRLSGKNLHCIFQDESGKIWIGTEFKGLDCLLPDSEKIEHFSTKDGLPSNMVSSIIADQQGFLWLATQGGIVRWDPTARTAIDFGTDDNLRNNQYNPRASLRLRDGRLFFGGTNGFSILSPTNIVTNPHAPQAVFTGMRLAGQQVPIGKWNGRTVLTGDLNSAGTKVHLAYSDRGIIFEFTGTDFTNPSKNKFAYRLVGFDEHWNETSADQHRAVYSFLKGGTYTLKVKAANNDNVWGEESSLEILVESPFWEKWWFILLCIAMVIGLAYLIVTYILAHQKAVFQEKSFKAEQEILRLKNENLEKEVESNQARLSASVLQSAHKNQFLTDLKTQIEKLETHDHALRKVVRAIDHEINQEDYWEQFQITFNQTHQNFIHQLEKLHPDITNNDVRLCCFIRMGMSNSEIATVLNITVNGVEQSKYRLKRKLGMEKEASLNDYIKTL